MLKLCQLMATILVGRWGHLINSKRGPPKDFSVKVWSQLAKQFPRRFLNIFPIGPYVKTMSADSSYLGRRLGSSETKFWTGTTKDHFIKVWPSNFRGDFKTPFPRGSYVKTMSADGGRLGWQVGSSDAMLKGDQLRTIPTKFDPNWPSSFRGDF